MLSIIVSKRKFPQKDSDISVTCTPTEMFINDKNLTV